MMASITSINSSDGPRNGHTVPEPRTTDAIGNSLRQVFGAPTLPDDMIRLLHEIDTRHGRH